MSVLVAVLPTTADGGLASKPYGLRLLLTLDRQSNYASTLGRQASIAFLDGASVNPAAAAFNLDRSGPLDLTASFIDGESMSGARIDAMPLSVRWAVSERASALVAYAHTRTPDPTGNYGLMYTLASDEYFAGYARRLSNDWSGGITLRFVTGDFSNELSIPAFGGALARVATDLRGPDIAIGIAGATGGGSVGFAATFGGVKTTNVVHNVSGFELPAPAPLSAIYVPPGATLDQFRDTIGSLAARGGFGFKANEHLGFYGDANYFHLDSQHAGSLDLGRFALGAEFVASPQWTLRAGVSIDTQSQVNCSAGFGVALSQTFDVQFAFQTNAAPELNAELGRTRLLALSIHARF